VNNSSQFTFSFAAVVTPRGDGSFVVSPGKAVIEEEVTPRIAATFLGISRSGVYLLCETGLLEYRKPSPGKILITVESLKKHKAASRDPEFWDSVDSVRKAH
jgi:hypothetical protein